jgi:centromere protein C
MKSSQKHREDQYLDLRNDADLDQVMGDDYGLDEQYQDEQYAPPASSPEVDAESPLQATKKRRGAALADEPVAKKSKSKPPNNVGSSNGKGSASHAIAASKTSARNADVRPAKGTQEPPKVSKHSNKEVLKKSGSRKAERKDSSPSRIASSPIVHRGPPRPKHNRGLYILRRETPDDGVQTRSGRHVIKPVAYWKNETVVYGDDEEADGDASFLLPTVKEVIRADHVDQPKAKRGTRKAGGASKSKKARQESESEEDDLAEPWESEPGRIYGAIRTWDPEDPIGEESGEKEDEIALSSAAIITRDIAGASFRFAKTLTLPFFGSGMVDLPPGAVKKTKNSRRMQMVFFIFSGRVRVTVNDNAFRIGKGGMWQVPRGECACAGIVCSRSLTNS